MFKRMLLFSILILIICSQSLLAVGVLYNRPIWDRQGEYDKMWIKKVDVDVSIQDQVAETHIDQTFYNELNSTVEAICIFPLPENAVITELVYWFNGQRYVADIRERQEARQDYENNVRRNIDPALLEYLGDNLFRLSIAPINARTDVRTEITYVELLPYNFGKVTYQFLLNTLEMSPLPLETVTFDLTAISQNDYKLFGSPSHEPSTQTVINKISDRHYTIFYGDENYYPDKDFYLEFETIRDDVQFNALSYTPAPEDSFGTDSFYALWITPPDDIGGDEVVPKDIIFTADVSGSMEIGGRIHQLKEAIHFFLDLLNPIDRFNIVTFGTAVQSFKPDLVPAEDGNISDAHDFVYQMYAGGMTAIDQALQTSLQQSFRDSTSNSIVFLTDGYPTLGETRIDSIVARATRANTKDVQIYCFGVGDDISKPLLIQVSRLNHGYPTFITSNDSVALVVKNHFTRISKPVMTNLDIDLGGLKTWDRYPKVMGDLFWGGQILQQGLYSNSGTFSVTLSGDVRGQQFQYSHPVTFVSSPGSGHRFVARLWAKAKIDFLMEQIDIYGEQQELVDQITELSLRFQVLTPYTAFYSDPETDVEENDSIEKPEQFVLHQNYPNPFNPTTEISYTLPKSIATYHVTIKIYDVLGRLVKVLVDNHQSAGTYSVIWDATDMHTRPVASGVYFYTLQAGDFKMTKKMMLMR